MPEKLEQEPCPLWHKKCSEVNVPVRQCDWFVPVTVPHPTITGSTINVSMCKLDLIVKLLGEMHAFVNQVMVQAKAQMAANKIIRTR